MIEAVSLCKRFERTEKAGRRNRKEEFYAVDHLSLRAQEGELIGILGPNGAGKTTLLRMLGMLMTPDGGQVLLRDRSGIPVTDPAAQKAAIGYLSGNTKLYPRFSAREYLAFLGEIYGFSRSHTRERTQKIFQLLDMEAFGDNRMERLSTGQMQRASIARCLFADPDIYILDEPTLGLDILSADAIIRFMKTQKERGKTVLYSTHYLEEAQFLCDIVYLILDGKIAAQGTPAQLMAQTETKSLREAFHAVCRRAESGEAPLAQKQDKEPRGMDKERADRQGEPRGMDKERADRQEEPQGIGQKGTDREEKQPDTIEKGGVQE